MRVLKYITGDTPQAGFRRIGSSEGFPADSLPYLNNGDSLLERSRIQASYDALPKGEGIRVLSHVWEYQSGKYGTPVVIHSMAAIKENGRSHAFSEYAVGLTDNIAELADAGHVITASEKTEWLSAERFMSIPGRNTIECQETEWDLSATDCQEPKKYEINDKWRKVLLSHYWKQASIRAFSEDAPQSVMVSLGSFSNDKQEDTEITIREAKRFFTSAIVPGLPSQVQNIASMAAGVYIMDTCTLYSALEFYIDLDLPPEAAMRLNGYIPNEYKLNAAEMDFITEISEGKTPELVRDFFERYRKYMDEPTAKETQVPFMADYRVWYTLWCIDRIIHEKHSFIEKAELTREHGNPNSIGDARACYLLLLQLRNILEKDHRVETKYSPEIRAGLMGPLESGLHSVMLEDIRKADAKPFLLRRTEMVDFHKRFLYSAPAGQLDALISLAMWDAAVAQAPQFVRCYPDTSIRNDAADERNARLLGTLLDNVMDARIQRMVENGETADKYLSQLKNTAFAENWALDDHCVKTKQAVQDFLKTQLRNPRKYQIVYPIAVKYFTQKELEAIQQEEAEEPQPKTQLSQQTAAQSGMSVILYSHLAGMLNGLDIYKQSISQAAKADDGTRTGREKEILQKTMEAIDEFQKSVMEIIAEKKE